MGQFVIGKKFKHAVCEPFGIFLLQGGFGSGRQDVLFAGILPEGAMETIALSCIPGEQRLAGQGTQIAGTDCADRFRGGGREGGAEQGEPGQEALALRRKVAPGVLERSLDAAVTIWQIGGRGAQYVQIVAQFRNEVCG
ncbi:hypothetical protein SDC9_182570 [bioreactor metagenome]|uniref:Uncharacterized protein n=1 Tax=bioreactor metagenome TaxID=1076179 RepID=A0A645H987_9ZZZZ